METDFTVDGTTLAWVLGGLVVAVWVLRRLFRRFRRLALLVLVILGVAWLLGWDTIWEAVSASGLTSD